MPTFVHRLSTKLLLAILAFLLLLGAATAFLVTFGFRQTQHNASQRSIQALEDQGRAALLQITQRQATINNTQLQKAVEMADTAVDYMVTMERVGGQVPWDADALQRGPQGQLFDANPARRTAVWLGPGHRLDVETKLALRRSAVLDTLFPALLDQSADTVAIYYMSPQGLGRYYPLLDLVDILPPDFAVTEQPFFALAAPVANPDRSPVWAPPYLDYVGMGPIVTASVPVYNDDDFQGVIAVDVSLARLIEQLNRLQITPNSYALLVDNAGNLVAAPPQAVAQLLGRDILSAETDPEAAIAATIGLSLSDIPNPTFQETLDAMRKGASGLAQFELDGQPIFLAYAPLRDVGWSLAVVSPIDEITAEAEAVTTAIHQDANDTIQSTLFAMGLFFLLALVITASLSRRSLTHPIEALVAATRAVANGDLSISIPVRSRDELGLLADSFNQMTDQLVQAQQTLEQRVADRTRALAALYEVTAVASQSLELTAVLENSLEQVLNVMTCPMGTIHLLNEAENVLELAAQRGSEAGIEATHRRIRLGQGLAGWVIEHGEPLATSDMVGDKRALPTSGEQQAYLGAPMRAKGEVRGVLSVIGTSDRRFTAEEVALLSSIADQVGVAVENARLYQQAEQLAVVEERQRLARELHDSVTQSLYSVSLLAETGQRSLRSGDLAQAEQRLNRLGEVAQQALQEMRLLVYELRPAALNQEGLVGALQQRLDAVEGRAGIESHLLVEGETIDLPAPVEANLYRIAQEALNNALKHAEASEVTVRIQAGKKEVTLEVTDNGRGFDVDAVQAESGIGLHSMRERAERLQGTFSVASIDQAGTMVKVSLPRREAGDEHEVSV